MAFSNNAFIHGVMSGEGRGFGATMTRGLLTLAEPAYAATVSARNALLDRQIGVKRLTQPVISVGNITTGGTGKTPFARWLAARLRIAGQHPAVLLRGYKALDKKESDEQILLDLYLNKGRPAQIPVVANPDRVACAETAMSRRKDIDVFILDDGFQHRKLARDLDIVLINASEPFGFGHVLPRGLLREPLRGLKRADVIVITHADGATPERLREIEHAVRTYNVRAPLMQSSHALLGLRSAALPAGGPPDHKMPELRQHKFFAFTGIGDPASLHRDLQKAGGKNYVGQRWFPDHYAYTSSDIKAVLDEGRAAGAEVLVTTEKDWVKVSKFPLALEGRPPIWRLEAEIRIRDNDEAMLTGQILEAMERSRRDHPPKAPAEAAPSGSDIR